MSTPAGSASLGWTHGPPLLSTALLCCLCAHTRCRRARSWTPGRARTLWTRGRVCTHMHICLCTHAHAHTPFSARAVHRRVAPGRTQPSAHAHPAGEPRARSRGEAPRHRLGPGPHGPTAPPSTLRGRPAPEASDLNLKTLGKGRTVRTETGSAQTPSRPRVQTVGSNRARSGL